MQSVSENNSFAQQYSPDGGFLQSEEWRKFQKVYGRRTFHTEGDSFWANIIEHKLPIVGSYFYVPRGPVICHPELISGSTKIPGQARNDIQKLINLAKENEAGWIRFESASKEILENIKQSINYKIQKAPHDMQPKEIFVIDITKPEEQLLAEMKAKTRYNIKLSQKRGVSAKVISNFQFPISNKIQNPNDQNSKYYFDKFIELVKITAERNEINAHPEEYYRKMWEILPAEMLKLYVAEYEEKIIAANLVLFYGKFATYLHGASDNEFREVMAPYLLQWQAIKDAKGAGCEKYDFGGISTNYESGTNVRITNRLQGVTKFKMGFSPEMKPINFPGTYDIIIDKRKYGVYKIFQFLKKLGK